VFLLNFAPAPRRIELGALVFECSLDGRRVTKFIELEPFESTLLERPISGD